MAINRILTESKWEAQNLLICFNSKDGTAESSAETRFSNASINAKQIIITNLQNGKWLQANVRNIIKHKLLYYMGIWSNFYLRALYVHHGRFQCQKQSLSGDY